MATEEPALDPGRTIIDPHLHHWEIFAHSGQQPQRFLFDEARAEIAASGHAVTCSVYVECGQMYRPDGPMELRSLGETEFATGVAAMAASGAYGPCRLAHRIVGAIDLTVPNAASVIEAHQRIAGARFRGIRTNTAFSEGGLFGFPCDPALRDLVGSALFRAGAAELAARDLSLDVWCLDSQLASVATLADMLPDMAIVLDHCATPDPAGPADAGERLALWAGRLRDVAQRPNVHIKIGGLGMDVTGPLAPRSGPASSAELAERWRPLVETCIDIFTPARAMFESNFPPDNSTATYGATWNAFKRLSAGLSEDEQDALFRGTAARVYRISDAPAAG